MTDSKIFQASSHVQYNSLHCGPDQAVWIYFVMTSGWMYMDTAVRHYCVLHEACLKPFSYEVPSQQNAASEVHRIFSMYV